MCADFSKKKAMGYGLSDWNRQKDEIESSIERNKEIREAINELSYLEEKIILRGYGIEIESDNERLISTESEESCDWNSEKKTIQRKNQRVIKLIVKEKCPLDNPSEEYTLDPDRV